MAGARTQDISTGGQRPDARLSGAADVLARLRASCAPASAALVAPADAVGAFAASDIVAAASAPASAVALVDGRAASSHDLIGASPMSPAFVSSGLPAVRVGDAMPADCDCVIDATLVAPAGPGVFEVHGGAAPGDGVRRAGDDIRQGDVIAPAGARLSAVHALALEAQGVSAVPVRRPKVRIVATPAEQDATSRYIGALAREDGATIEFLRAKDRSAGSIAAALPGDFDALFVVGGTGAGAGDCAVQALRSRGEVFAHGLALDPGRTGAAGVIDGRPVVCLPGRFDGALAVYLALGRPALRAAAGAGDAPIADAAPLARKISSAVGVAQLVLLSFAGGRWTPLCVGDVTLAHLLRARAYLVVAESSEGVAEGAVVQPRLLRGQSPQP